MFFRRRVIAEGQQLFDPQWRDVGDGEWMLRLLQKKICMATLGEFTSTFMQTGANMSAGPNAQRENRRLRATAPAWAKAARPLIILHHRLRRWLGGMYRQEPFRFALYTSNPAHQRVIRQVVKPVGRYNAAHSV
jgi:hypothetical protein